VSQSSLFDHDREALQPAAPPRRRFPVRIIRSARRRRTVHARLVDGVIEVRVPADMSKADEDEFVAELVARLEKREQRAAVDLDARCRDLARRYGLPLPASIRFVDNQRSRWGSCTIDTREIRLSSKLADFPAWVLDYVIVHELAHLIHADHSRAFHALVDRYPKAERARGYLIAKGDCI
jgi:predicted metal-dependent hydrolase